MLVIAFATAIAAGCDSIDDIPAPDRSIDVFVGAHIQALGMDRGSSIQLLVEATDLSGSAIPGTPSVTFLSRNPGIVTVNANGLVTGVSDGRAYVVAALNQNTIPSVLDSIAVTVVSPSKDLHE